MTADTTPQAIPLAIAAELRPDGAVELYVESPTGARTTVYEAQANPTFHLGIEQAATDLIAKCLQGKGV